MFNGLLQPTHLILILVVVLIVFGPGKLPEAGKALGKAMKDMRDAFSAGDEAKNTGQPEQTGHVEVVSRIEAAGAGNSSAPKEKKAG